jgi:hypothetical protein
MTVLTEIGQRLDETLAELNLGSTLFLGQEPDDPDTCVTLYAAPGGEPEWTMGAEDDTPIEPIFEPHRVQAVIRNANTQTAYPDAEKQAWRIYRQLSLVNATLSGVRYLLIEPTAVPAPLDEDKKGRLTFVVNFTVFREVSHVDERG